MIGSDYGSNSETPSEASSASPTPSPIRETPDHHGYEVYSHYTASPREQGNHRGTYDMASDSEEEANAGPNYVDEILEYFISDSSQIPDFLVNPPKDFDPNIAIDDEGHTALHWASAMGRMRVVKLLFSAGADIFAGARVRARSTMLGEAEAARHDPTLAALAACLPGRAETVRDAGVGIARER